VAPVLELIHEYSLLAVGLGHNSQREKFPNTRLETLELRRDFIGDVDVDGKSESSHVGKLLNDVTYRIITNLQ